MMALTLVLTLFSALVRPGAEEGETGDLMSHILDHVVIPLPTFFGIDLSITHHTLMMWAATAILMLVLPALFRRSPLVPHGFANAIEALVVFLREDVIYNYLGKDGKKFEPLILTVFFFILANNLMGLVPGMAAATSDISVTSTLAIIIFLNVLIVGHVKHGLIGYWKGFIPAGVPIWVAPIVFVLEVLGVLIRHFVLAVRLFANMTAGHLTILVLISLVFIFQSYIVAVPTVAGAATIGILETIVAFVQAYIFTLLSAVFIGASIHQDH